METNYNATTEAIEQHYRADETACVLKLLENATVDPLLQQKIQQEASFLIQKIRERKFSFNLDFLFFKYDLASPQGIALMSLAESILRIPDKTTRKKLIQDKLHITPLIHPFVSLLMKILGKRFVMGTTIEEAIKRAHIKEKKGYKYSYDMLGEAAHTQQDAQHYFAAYKHAIQTLAQQEKSSDIKKAPGISVKLSALHPRFEIWKKEQLEKELLPRLIALIILAKEANISLTIDAEESRTLMLTLYLVEKIVQSDLLENWNGLGFAVQAYQKRAPWVLSYLIALLRKTQKSMMIRLVKGAYWDTEIKLAQVQGLNYPVYTRKMTTDVSYMVCAKILLAATDVIYPQFATHNALTLCTIRALAQSQNITQYEFQCLYGMGEALYKEVAQPCRIYAPVGTHETLLAYLVRRLLENGANTSFVHRIENKKINIEALLSDPVADLAQLAYKPHPQIPLAKDLYQPQRANSQGVDLTHPPEYLSIIDKIKIDQIKKYENQIEEALPTTTLHPMDIAEQAFMTWQTVPVITRVQYLEKMATLLQAQRVDFYALLMTEGGKTLEDAVSEVREAIDYCYYYAAQAMQHFAQPQTLQGPTGEHNQLSLMGKGVMLCISPWNFPLAIFLGQVSAALAAGNCVLAKPATQTPRIACKTVALLHQAGFPTEVVQLLRIKGSEIGKYFLDDQRVNGVIFTGSTQTAKAIHLQLAERAGPLVPLIAETGGQNAMIVDSSALPEQVVQDVITSAFRSAGQRCSALRVLFLQEDVAEKVITMLQGAMAELTVGDPLDLATDVGPLIDVNAKALLEAHMLKMQAQGKLLYQTPLHTDKQGAYFAPCLYEIASLDILTEEVFGPILHVVRFSSSQLDEVLAQIYRTGYGLTLGIHSRVDSTIEYICKKAQVGNIYVNRNMIGAVVGVQPFGGERLSGTGPKAGGPYYLPSLAIERTLSINTTASGGNTTLVSLTDDI